MCATILRNAFPLFRMSDLPFFLQPSAFLFTSVILVVTFVLLLIPSLLVPGAKPEAAAKAIGCYVLKTVGLLLLASSAIQLMYGLITLQFPDSGSLNILVLLLLVGLGIMVHQSRTIATIDDASVSVVRLVFCHTCEIIGALIALSAGLWLAINSLLQQQMAAEAMAGTLLPLGLLLMLLSSVHIRIKNGHRSKVKRK